MWQRPWLALVNMYCGKRRWIRSTRGNLIFFSGKGKGLSLDKFGEAQFFLALPSCLVGRWQRDGAAHKPGHLSTPHKMDGQKGKPPLPHTYLLLPCPCPAPWPCPCSISASNLETCLLTLLSHPWPRWLLNQAHPLALPTSEEMCLPSLVP